MSTFSLYRRDSNYQRMAPPSAIYEVNQWKSSNSGNRHLPFCFDVISVANILFFPLFFFLTTSTSWSYYDWHTSICIHSISYEFGTRFWGVSLQIFLVYFASVFITPSLTLYNTGTLPRARTRADLLNSLQEPRPNNCLTQQIIFTCHEISIIKPLRTSVYYETIFFSSAILRADSPLLIIT
jgi:hypothetical protein